MISLDHLLIDNRVLTQTFSCDVARCKGACCTLPGGAGAPLLDHEVELVRQSIPAALPYLSDRSRHHLDSQGAVEQGPTGWSTTCIDDADCVFVTYDGDNDSNVAVCSIEKAWHAGTSSFRKPLSCHLFPIRIANFGGPYLYYEHFSECAPGRERGKAEGTLLVESVREALDRAVGPELAQRIVAMALASKAGGSP